MKHLLNTLYILSEDIYLSLDGENVVANRDKQVAARYPLHTLQNIITFSYAGASPALMGACPAPDRACVLLPQGQISGKGMRGGKRKRSASPDTISSFG
jgi:CRISPR/Cas system-associated endonuclease Cas1